MKHKEMKGDKIKERKNVFLFKVQAEKQLLVYSMHLKDN
jgi:uncharacterized protein with von Willebrand factor type A (vWA) domain